MSTASMVEIAKTARRAQVARWNERSSRSRAEEFDFAIGQLARRLTDPDADGVASVIAPTLETLGRGLSAERAEYYAVAETPDASPRQIASWQPVADSEEGPVTTVILDAATHPELFAALEAGEVWRANRMQAPVRTGGWASLRDDLFVPCISASGLRGIVRLQAGLAAREWEAKTIDRAQSVGRLAGLALDRAILAREAADQREESAHKTRLELIGRVTSTAAHDLNNILTAILGYGDLLDLELGLVEGDPGSLDLSEMRDASKRAAGIVEELLRFGRRREDGARDVDLGETVAGLRGMLRQVVGRSVALELEPSTEALPVRIDPGRFENVLLNLASNARAAVGRGGRFGVSQTIVTLDEEGRDEAAAVEVPGARPGRYARLSASDDGCGMAPELLARVFEPFFTTKPAGEGTGLGLPCVAEFVKTEQGGLRVESTSGEGTTFHLYLPLRGDA